MCVSERVCVHVCARMGEGAGEGEGWGVTEKEWWRGGGRECCG